VKGTSKKNRVAGAANSKQLFKVQMFKGSTSDSTRSKSVGSVEDYEIDAGRATGSKARPQGARIQPMKGTNKNRVN
jgi:hypothetical protein